MRKIISFLLCGSLLLGDVAQATSFPSFSYQHVPPSGQTIFHAQAFEPPLVFPIIPLRINLRHRIFSLGTPLTTLFPFLSYSPDTRLRGDRAVSWSISLLFAAAYGAIAFGASHYGWSLEHISSSGLSQVAIIVSAAYTTQAISIIILRSASWAVRKGFYHFIVRLASKQPYLLISPKPKIFPLLPRMRNLLPANDIAFLAVRNNSQYINADLLNSFRYLPQWLQQIAYIPLGFFREHHERPAHFTFLNRLPWLANEFLIAYPMMTMIITMPVLTYAYIGDGWTGALLGLLVSEGIRNILKKWGGDKEKETFDARIAVQRLEERLNIKLGDDDKQRVLEAAGIMQKMLPKQTRPSLASVIDEIVSTNITTSGQFPLNELNNGLPTPPTFVFNPKVFASYEGIAPKQVAMTLGPDFVAVTSVSSQSERIENVLGKGGVRWYQAGPKPLKKFHKRLREILPEVVRLAETMGDKNPLADVFFDGGKTVILGKEGSDKMSIIRRWVASSMSAGVLLNSYIAGPDMGMYDQEMSEIVRTADYLHEKYPAQFPQRILATTSRTEQQGSYPHEDWTVTSISTLEAILSALEDRDLMSHLNIDTEHLTIAIQGFGDVGSGIIRYLADLDQMRPDLRLLERIRIVGVSDINGGIYNPEGLDISELLKLRDLQQQRKKQKQPFSLSEEYRSAHEKVDPLEVLFKGSTIIIPAAGPNVFKTPQDIQALKRAGTKIIGEGANNAIKSGLERVIAEQGIFYIPGAVANFGGVYTSTQEWLDVTKFGEAKVVERMQDRKLAIQNRIREIAHENMTRLLTWHKQTGKSIYELQHDAARKMRTRRSEILDHLHTYSGPTQWTVRVTQLILEGLPKKIAQMIVATEIARKEILASSMDSSTEPTVTLPAVNYFRFPSTHEISNESWMGRIRTLFNQPVANASVLWIGNLALGIVLTWFGVSAMEHSFHFITLIHLMGWSVPIALIHEGFHFPKGLANPMSWVRGFRVQTSGAFLLTAPIISLICATVALLISPTSEMRMVLLEAIVINLLALIPGSKLKNLPLGRVWNFLWKDSDMDEYLRTHPRPFKGLIRLEEFLAPMAEETPPQTLVHVVRWVPYLSLLMLISRHVWPFAIADVAFVLGFMALRLITVISTQRLIRPLLIDPLTGLRTINYLDLKNVNGYLPWRFRQASEAGRPVAAMFLDIDFFGKYNKRFGFKLADEKLREVAQAVQRAVRENSRPDSDVVRYGGEELVVLLYDLDPATAKAQAEQVAQAICNAVFALDIPTEKEDGQLTPDNPQGRMTISVGVALSEPTRKLRDDNLLPELNALLKTADSALVQKAKAGTVKSPPKNQFVLEEQLEEAQKNPPTPKFSWREKFVRAKGYIHQLFGHAWTPVAGEQPWRTHLSRIGWTFYGITVVLLIANHIFHFQIHAAAFAFLILIYQTFGDRLIEHMRVWRVQQVQMIDPKTKIPTKQFLELENPNGYLPRLYARATYQPGENATGIVSSFNLHGIVVEINDFKRINDTYGHDAGDRVLEAVAQSVRKTAKKDMTVRYQGKQFVVVVENTPEQDTQALAQTIEKAVRDLRIKVPGTSEPVRVSVRTGITTSPDANSGLDVNAWLDTGFQAAEQARPLETETGVSTIGPYLGPVGDPLLSQHDGQAIHMELGMSGQHAKEWVGAGDIDLLATLNQLLGKEVVGYLVAPQSANLRLYKRSLMWEARNLLKELFEAEGGLVYSGNGLDEFVFRLTGEEDDVARKLRRVQSDFNDHFNKRYAAFYIDRENLLESEEKAIIDMKGAIVLSRDLGGHILLVDLVEMGLGIDSTWKPQGNPEEAASGPIDVETAMNLLRSVFEKRPRVEELVIKSTKKGEEKGPLTFTAGLVNIDRVSGTILGRPKWAYEQGRQASSQIRLSYTLALDAAYETMALGKTEGRNRIRIFNATDLDELILDYAAPHRPTGTTLAQSLRQTLPTEVNIPNSEKLPGVQALNPNQFNTELRLHPKRFTYYLTFSNLTSDADYEPRAFNKLNALIRHRAGDRILLTWEKFAHDHLKDPDMAFTILKPDTVVASSDKPIHELVPDNFLPDLTTQFNLVLASLPGKASTVKLNPHLFIYAIDSQMLNERIANNKARRQLTIMASVATMKGMMEQVINVAKADKTQLNRLMDVQVGPGLYVLNYNPQKESTLEAAYPLARKQQSLEAKEQLQIYFGRSHAQGSSLVFDADRLWIEDVLRFLQKNKSRIVRGFLSLFSSTLGAATLQWNIATHVFEHPLPVSHASQVSA
jgi:diguanylate cyclase (GGDEF)-like protein